MDIKHKKVGNAGLVDSLRDFNLEIGGRSAPVAGRRLETLQALKVGGAAKLADNVQAEVGPSSEVGRDGLVTATEVAALASDAQLAKLGARRPGIEAQLPLLSKLVERPAAEPIALTPAYREIRREVSTRYDPQGEALSRLPAGFKAMAERVLDTLDNADAATRGENLHDLRLGKEISNALLERFLDLSDLELAAFEPDGPKLGGAGQRAVAEKLRRHLNEEVSSRDLEPANPRAAVTRFPVKGAEVKLETVPVPDYEQVGRNRVHNLNRVLTVQVPPGHTVLVNAQATTRTALGGPNTELGERVLSPTPNGAPHELNYLPGIAEGNPAELWITVLKGTEVIGNQSFAVPQNPITERVTRVVV